MGINSRLRDLRPPLPAPTDSMDEGGQSGFDTDVATNVTTRTDKTSYEVPEDGSPVTIPTQKLTSGKEVSYGGRHTDKSQTSLLIEYFEGSKVGDKTKSKPSVRVKVTPSSRKKSGSHAHDAVQITGIGKDRKPSYTKRISLGGTSSKHAEVGLAPTEATEVSLSSGSNLSRPPVEVEVIEHNGSDLSGRSRGLTYAVNESNVSSMPPDSMLEGSYVGESERSRTIYQDDDITVTEDEYLSAPLKERNRSASRDRIAQKVMEKLGQSSSKPSKTSKSRSQRSLDREYEHETYSREHRRRRSSKSRDLDEDTVTGADSSVLSSNIAPSQKSYRSGSEISNNPKLLGMVEDTIKRIILPEINAIKQDQKTDRNIRSYESSRRPSLLDDGLVRRVSKSSSSPNISSKPKILLNRDGDDPGTVLSRGDSERKMRKSSRGSYTEDRPSSRKSSGKHSSTTLRDVSAASLGAGILTAAALKHHDSQGEVQERRKKRSKSRGSRSRSASINEKYDETYTRKEDIPPLPMASRINDSEITRESIVSGGTERPSSSLAIDQMPIREVSRGSVGDAMSPTTSRTPTRTPVSRGLGMSHGNMSIDSPKSPNSGHSTKERMAALAAAGLTGTAAAVGAEEIYERHVDTDGYGDSPSSQRKISSPVQSVSSIKKNFEEEALVPGELRPRSAASRSSAGRLGSAASSPRSRRSLQQSPRDIRDSYRASEITREASGTPGTPQGETVDDWYERQHLLNDQYRNSLDAETSNRDSFTAATNRMSYQTNPYPEDEKRWTMFSDDSREDPNADMGAEQDVRALGTNPQYVHTPLGAESAVASLMEPSMISSDGGSPTKTSYSDRMTAHLREMGKDTPPVYQGSTLSQTVPSRDRWDAIKSHARTMSGSPSKDGARGMESPVQQTPRSLREQQSMEGRPVMGASGLPMAHDPLPEIGHFDDSKSDVTTNPSIIHGPLGGDVTGNDTWPYTPEPTQPVQSDRDSRSLKSGQSKEAEMLAGAVLGTAAMGATAAGIAASRVSKQSRQPTVEDEYDAERRLTPDVGRSREYIDRNSTPASPNAFRDEGYVTDARTRSAGALTPRVEQQLYSKADMDEYQRAMDAQDLRGDDVFDEAAPHNRNVSGDSHGMASPLYDSATGKGMENIQSKDVVALMDHLTVRDAQRNARDTEILVTLVRSAAEMRNSFDEIKRFIVDQDRMIMQNTDRGADRTASKVLGGPRPQPSRTDTQFSQEDVQTKRKGVLRRALKGLTGSKSASDLAKVEGMLMQILENVEDLKTQGPPREPLASYTSETLDTYERLRAVPDSGYEPEGLAGTSSTPSHSGNLSLTPRGEKQQFHSGYDGRRGSQNRVSTVLEGDEDDLEPHENLVLDHQFENNERMLTPTQESQRQRELSPGDLSPQYGGAYSSGPINEITPRSADKQRKHKSNSSSVFGVPKTSRWSKTTSSSAAPDPATIDSPNAGVRYQKASSEASRSGSALDQYDDDEYDLMEDDRLRSNQSLAREQHVAETRSMRSQASKLTRTPSPLIPSEASFHEREAYLDEDEPSPIQEDLEPDFEDPKYQAHRNSLLLQHPQPRQGTTGRHQNTLESQVYDIDSVSGANSDVSQRSVSDFDPATWGSSGTAGLAKHKLNQFEPLSPVSMSSPGAHGVGRYAKEDPLVPQQKPVVPPKIKHEEPEQEPQDEWEPLYSNSGFSRGGHYSSPFGSGHLLEPIEEVRYSLETDSGHLSPEPQVASAKAVDMRSTGRKITPSGPRAMPGSNQAKLVETSGYGTVRRKPVSGNY